MVEETVDVSTGEIKEVPAGVPALADKHRAVMEQPPPERPKRARSRQDDIKTVSEIAGALARITAEVGVVPKDGFNKFHGYKYATMGDVLIRLTPLLAKYGIVIMQTETDRSMFDDGRVLAVQYEFTIAHSSGEVWPDRPKQTGVCRCRDSKGGWDDKAFNKAHTAARKYFLLALFQIATGESDSEDADRDGPPPSEPRRAPPPSSPKPYTPAQMAKMRAHTKEVESNPVIEHPEIEAGDPPTPPEQNFAQAVYDAMPDVLPPAEAAGWSDETKAEWKRLADASFEGMARLAAVWKTTNSKVLLEPYKEHMKQRARETDALREEDSNERQ